MNRGLSCLYVYYLSRVLRSEKRERNDPREQEQTEAVAGALHRELHIRVVILICLEHFLRIELTE